ncbi:MAG: hypothetical protein Barrevirus2_7 [Barrevirus sp.]|uniref:Uncharacterized protein n=1 Tax=Barrevirus sp. TaxID=2487763 RepID=A0A3G4ZR85_9VIRU|nr:MAG: hypothetical protein Barrevirus2_7 [Barrevirus sp.]
MSNTKNEPNGGFLPIYICDEEESISNSEQQEGPIKREYETYNKSISIKTLMEKRRAKNPLIKNI